MCEGDKVLFGLSSEMLILMGCVCFCQVLIVFGGGGGSGVCRGERQRLLVVALGSIDRRNFINGEKVGMIGVYFIFV